MAFEANDTAFNVAANLLVEADRIRHQKSRPTHRHRLSSNDSFITDSGFHSPSEPSSSDSVSLRSCPVSKEMISLCKKLLLFYYEEKILADDPPVEIRSGSVDDQLSGTVDTFLASAGVSFSNAWSIGARVASHVLESLPRDLTSSVCKLENEVEVYLSLVLSITSPLPVARTYLKRARKLGRHRHGEISEYVLRRQIAPPGNLVVSSLATSSTLEDRIFAPSHTRSRSSPPSSAIFSFSSRFSSFSSSSKGQPTPPIVLTGSDALGSFSVTSPARHTLRSVISPRREPGRAPLPWQLEIPVSPSQEDEAFEGKDLPTISRTPDSVTDTVSSLERQFAHVRAQTLPSPSLGSPVKSESEMNSILALVEQSSKFKIEGSCAKCHKIGYDFPKCPKCGDMWCSRPCRLYGGKRHVCGKDT